MSVLSRFSDLSSGCSVNPVHNALGGSYTHICIYVYIYITGRQSQLMMSVNIRLFSTLSTQYTERSIHTYIQSPVDIGKVKYNYLCEHKLSIFGRYAFRVF